VEPDNENEINCSENKYIKSAEEYKPVTTPHSKAFNGYPSKKAAYCSSTLCVAGLQNNDPHVTLVGNKEARSAFGRNRHEAERVGNIA
jgi:hypothetical protein